MFSPCSELVIFMYWTGKSMNSILSFCGLVDVRINASDKDLPVTILAYTTSPLLILGLFFFVAPSKAKYDKVAGSLVPMSTYLKER